MSSVYKMFRVLTLAVMVGAVVVAQSEAATIRIAPATQDATIGDTVSADIMVEGLLATESIGAVSLLLSFNDSILEGLSYEVDPDAMMGVATGGIDFSFGFDGGTGSPLDLFFLADAGLDHAGLKALQGDGFRLATVSFTAIADGLSGLNLGVSPDTGVFLSDALGVLEVPADAVNGSVCVGGAGACAVPEPGLLALLGAGLSGMAVRRRARARV